MNKRLDFDWLANNYDLLTKLVFGKSLKFSQLYFLHLLPQHCKILFVGGGTGQMLTYIFQTNPTCHVWFVEASEKMLSQARQKIPQRYTDRIRFIHGTEMSLPPDARFDVIVTNFFLDLYPEKELTSVCASLNQRLRCAGLWFASDFIQGGKWWQDLLLWLMYRFFVLTCRIPAKRLPEWEQALQNIGLFNINQALFYRGFIKSIVLKKPGLDNDFEGSNS